MINLKVKLLRPSARPPERMTEGAAGLDCCSAAEGAIRVHPDCRAVVPLGFAIEIPPGWFGRLSGRSGLAFGHGVVEYEGTIDADYRGEVKALLINHGDRAYDIHPGERCCQLIVLPAPEVRVDVVDALSPSARGEKGIGSTGKRERRAVVVHEQHCPIIELDFCTCNPWEGS